MRVAYYELTADRQVVSICLLGSAVVSKSEVNPDLTFSETTKGPVRMSPVTQSCPGLPRGILASTSRAQGCLSDGILRRSCPGRSDTGVHLREGKRKNPVHDARSKLSMRIAISRMHRPLQLATAL